MYIYGKRLWFRTPMVMGNALYLSICLIYWPSFPQLLTADYRLHSPMTTTRLRRFFPSQPLAQTAGWDRPPPPSPQWRSTSRIPTTAQRRGTVLPWRPRPQRSRRPNGLIEPAVKHGKGTLWSGLASRVPDRNLPRLSDSTAHRPASAAALLPHSRPRHQSLIRSPLRHSLLLKLVECHRQFLPLHGLYHSGRSNWLGTGSRSHILRRPPPRHPMSIHP